MALTLGDLIYEARGILQDRDSELGYRYTEGDLYKILNMALIEVNRIRPDSQFGNVYNETGYPDYDTPDSATEFPLDIQFYQPCVHFIAGFAELRDDEYTVGGRASALLKTFRDMLTGTA